MLKIVRMPSSRAGRGGVLHRRVMRRRKKKRDARFAQAPRLPIGRAGRWERRAPRATSALPARLDTARLPCLATRDPERRDDDGRRGRDVERAEAVAAGSAGVERRVEPVIDRDHRRAHGLAAAEAIMAGVSPRMRSATDEAGNLRGRPAAGEDGFERCTPGPAARLRRAGDLSEDVGEGDRIGAHASSSREVETQFLSSAMPSSVRIDSGMKLHALDGQRLVAKPHDLALARPGADLEHVGQARPFDEERMVARRGERRGQA